MKTIDFETHFVTQEWVDATYANPGYPRFKDDPATGRRRMYYREDAFEPHGDFLLNRLLDIGDGRIAEMDKGGIDKAILSLTSPGVDHFEPSVGTGIARRANDELAAAIARHPDRLMGFAALAPKDPRCGRRRAGALRQGVRLQGLEDTLQLRRLLHRREALLAHPGQGRGTGRGHLPAPGGSDDQGAAHLRPGAGRRRLRLRRGDRHRHDAAGAVRRVRRLPEAQDHARPLRRGPALPHAAHRPPVRPAAPQGRRSRGRCPISSGCRASTCATTC